MERERAIAQERESRGERNGDNDEGKPRVELQYLYKESKLNYNY